MPTVNIEEKLYHDIKNYCQLNNLAIGAFVNDLLKKNFLVEKYDDAPPFLKKKKTTNDSTESCEVMDSDNIIEQHPEPVKKKKYIKPDVISVEDKKKDLTAKEIAKKRVQYL